VPVERPFVVAKQGECGHNPEWDCGCWRYAEDTEGEWRRHSFRFVPGDRVFWCISKFGPLKGVTGTVQRWGGGSGYVKWDDHCKNWAPSSFPSNFEIQRIDERKEGT
jgi:hypothetical protein